MTGENSDIVLARAQKLGLRDVFVGVEDKAAALREYAGQNDTELHEIAFIGDDVNDVPVMKLVGLAACPADAQPENQDLSHYRCRLGYGL